MFEKKVAIVTGAGSGIGQSLSGALCTKGASVILADWNAEKIDNAANVISKNGGSARAVTIDVCDFEAVKQLVDGTLAKFGRIDYMFNNAGIAVGGEVRDVSIENWQSVINVNLFGVIHGVAAVYPVMVKQGFGHIVNTASIEGLVPFPGTVSYVATKHGVVGLSTALRLEAKDLGVRVSVVCPGHIKTAIFGDSNLVNIEREKVLDQMAKIPGITPEACARAILRGVEKNKAIIVITAYAKILYMLQRLSPGLVLKIMRHHVKNLRDARIEG